MEGEQEDMSDIQQALVRQFQEVTNVDDMDVAMATLASVDWDLERAITAQLSVPDEEEEVRVDEPPMITPPTRPNVRNGMAMRAEPWKILDDHDDGDFEQDGNRSKASSSARLDRSLTNESSGMSKGQINEPSGSSKWQMTGRMTSVPVTAHSRSDDSDDEPYSLRNRPAMINSDLFDDDQGIRVYATPGRSSSDDRVPLIPTDFISVEEAIQNFTTVFESRYGYGHPPFFGGDLGSAVREAFDPSSSFQERRPLAIYLHDDDAVGNHVFAGNVLCSEAVCQLLRAQFLTWPWDMTQPENRTKLLQWLDVVGLNEVRHEIDHYRRERYPLLVLVVREKGSLQALQICTGVEDSGTAMTRLMVALDFVQQQKATELQEEAGRQERQVMRDQQAVEYERALAADRARLEKIERERAVEREEAAIKERERMALESAAAAAAAELPAEPSASDSNCVLLRLRWPGGAQETRRFRKTEPLRHLLTFAASRGYSADRHRFWNSEVPKKDLTVLNPNASFEALKWPVREQITVEEK